jgi:hypothetical protein
LRLLSNLFALIAQLFSHPELSRPRKSLIFHSAVLAVHLHVWGIGFPLWKIGPELTEFSCWTSRIGS